MADRKISDLTALTAPAAGDYLPIVDISEVAAASKNKRITIEELFRGVPLGTAAAPSIAIEGDENTGIYSPGADQLAVATNGTGRLFVTALGSIGVNTDSPGFIFQIQHSTQDGIRLRTANTSDSHIDFADTDANGRGRINYDHATDSMGFRTASAERMRITSAGLVGVGTSSPVAFLHASGSGSSSLRLTDTQAYSFGTSGPTLDLTGNDSSGANTLFARLKGNPNNGNPDRGFLDILTRVDGITTSTLQVGTGLTANVLVPNGRVGIGTSAPGQQLDCTQSIRAGNSGGNWDVLIGNRSANWSAGLSFQGSSTNRNWEIGQNRLATGALTFTPSTAGGGATFSTPLVTFTSTAVGIGTTSPTAPLQIGSGSGLQQAYISGGGYDLLLGASGGSAFGFASQSASLVSNNTSVPLVIGTIQSQPLVFGSANFERARIDSSGRLLVGTSTARTNFSIGGTGYAPQTQFEGGVIQASVVRASSPVIGLAASDAAASGTGTGNISFFGNDGTNLIRTADITSAVDGTPGANDMPGRIVLSTTADGAASPTERMRITSTGNMLLGSAAAVYAAGERFSVSPASNTNGVGIALGNNNNVGIGIYHGYTATGTAIAMQFQDHNATVRGSITVTTSATAYNTSSDYRLKENVAEVTDGITRLQQLKPSRFNFIADPDKTVDGFIAHEVQDIVPEAITGEKDAVDDDGNPVYQGIDQSKLVPLLTAALQEAIDEIESLKARVAALEAQ